MCQVTTYPCKIDSAVAVAAAAAAYSAVESAPDLHSYFDSQLLVQLSLVTTSIHSMDHLTLSLPEMLHQTSYSQLTVHLEAVAAAAAAVVT